LIFLADLASGLRLRQPRLSFKFPKKNLAPSVEAKCNYRSERPNGLT